MSKREPSEAQLEAARKARPVHHPATEEYRESWSVANPRGADIYYGSYEEALAAARTGIY
jgi:hypothetical protein